VKKAIKKDRVKQAGKVLPSPQHGSLKREAFKPKGLKLWTTPYKQVTTVTSLGHTHLTGGGSERREINREVESCIGSRGGDN